MSKENNNIPQEDFEQIENYLLNKMTNDEKLVFENNLETDSKLKEKVEECRMLIDAIEIESLKEKMNDFHNDVSSDVISITKKPRNQWQRFAMAASIAILIGLGGFWFLNNEPQHQKLYSKYYKPDPGLPTVMSSTNEYDFYEAMVDYKRGNYKRAIEKWENILPIKPQNDTLNYFLGTASLANNKISDAKTYLETPINNNSSIFKSEAYYYLGLTYLKEGDLELAKSNFKLSDTDLAKEILKELKE